MFIKWQASKNLEAASIMDLIGNVAQFSVQLWKRKCVFVDEAEWFAKSFCRFSISQFYTSK